MNSHITNERKIQEIAHYNVSALCSGNESDENLELKPALNKIYKLLQKYAPHKRILDYCCGHGKHAISISKMGAKEVIGIDLSEKSIDVAKELLKDYSHINPVNFHIMDGESLDFEDSSFDIVFDSGAFSSLDISAAIKEIHRVLKSGGLLIGIETLGHNPIMNIKRFFNVRKGKRTKWAYDHIFKMKDFRLLNKYFTPIHKEFCELTTLFGQTVKYKSLVKAGNIIDSLLLRIPFVQKMAFKTIFVFKKP